MTPLKKALVAIQNLKRQVASYKARERDPVAIIGMACRFPGGVDSPRAYFEALREQRVLVGEIPESRWDVDAYFDRDPSRPGAMVTRWAALVEDVDQFDATAFGINAREADAMDPLQRMLLQTAWHALEDARIPIRSLVRKRVGVFVGASNSDYGRAQLGDEASIDGYTATGAAMNMIAGRLAFFLDVTGPALTIDTACSSSMSALYAATRALRSGDCDLAIVGGVSAYFSPANFIAYTKLGLFAADGRCKPLDARADGIVGGEGCGVIVLQRASDVDRARTRIRALIRAVACNQDGKSAGITAPNAESQRAVIQNAVEQSGVEPASIGFVEMHGTGTSLGDPIEVEALRGTVGARTEGAGPLYLGAVKANVGHLEAAAGIAATIKAVLSLENELIVAQPDLGELNPHLRLEGTRISVHRENIPWPRGATPRRCGVSAFGWSGTNVHAVLEEAPIPSSEASGWASQDGSDALYCPITARSQAALTLTARALREALDARLQAASTEAERRQVAQAFAHSCRVSRSRWEHVGVAIARDPEALSEGLAAIADGREPNGGVLGVQTPESGKVAFVFPGQGWQWKSMAMGLLRREPAFSDALASLDPHLSPYLGRPVRSFLEQGELGASIAELQPLLFAVEVAIAKTWASWGLTADVVIGHSMGEVAAAHVAGWLSAEDACKIIGARSKLLATISGRGAMLLVELGQAAAAELVRDVNGVSVAVVNAAGECVLSGDKSALESLQAGLERSGTFNRWVKVDVASHSSQVDDILGALRAELAGVGVERESAPVEMISTVTARPVKAGDLGIDYWIDNLRETVRFADALGRARADGARTFVEISGHPILTTAMAAELGSDEQVFGSLRRDQDDWCELARAAAAVSLRGSPVEPPLEPAPIIDLPPYGFENERHMREVSDHTARAGDPVLGVHVDTPTGRVWERVIGPELATSLAGHAVVERAVVPAALLLEWMHTAATRRLGEPVELYDVRLEAMLEVEASTAVVLEVREIAGGLELALFCKDPGLSKDAGFSAVADKADALRRIATCRARERHGSALAPMPPGDAGAHTLEPDRAYGKLRAVGLAYADAFRMLGEIAVGSSEASAAIGASAEPVHGFTWIGLDGGLQLAAFAGAEGRAVGLLPVRIGAVQVDADPGSARRARARRRPDGRFDIEWLDDSDRVVAAMTGVEGEPLPTSHCQGLWTTAWEDAPLDTLPSDFDTASWTIVDVGDAELEAVMRPACERVDRSESAPAHWLVMVPALGASAAGDAAAIERAMKELLAVFARAMRPNANLRVILVVSRGASDAYAMTAAIGALVRSAALELGGVSVRHVCVPSDVDTARRALEGEMRRSAAGTVRFDESLRRQVLTMTANAADGPRTTERGAHAVTLVARPAGALDRLAFETTMRRPLAAGEVEVEVAASGVNFSDVMKALGIYPGQSKVPALGLEGAGTIVRIGTGVSEARIGERVMFMASGAIASHAIVREDWATPLPAHLSFEQAAGIPAAFITAYHSLCECARMTSGETVLIHSASGGVGWAAIQIARARGARIIATAGTEAKRAWLHEHGVEHVFDSRSHAFRDAVLALGGADVVLNSLSGALLEASLETLRSGGRFIELGKTDVFADRRIGLAALRENRSFAVVDMATMQADAPERVARLLTEIAREIGEKRLVPPPVEVRDGANPIDIIREFAEARHCGKIVIRPPGSSAQVRRGAGLLSNSEGVVVVTGGTGGVGSALVEWLSARGVTRFAVLTRKGGDARVDGLPWPSGVEVRAHASDLANASALAALFDDIESGWGPIVGVVHAAGVLDDSTIEKLTDEQIARVLAPKVRGTLVLDEALGKRDLEFFLACSSAAATLGAAGQAHYAAANGFIDGWAEARRATGRSATSIGWGAWRDVGLVARDATRARTVAAQGLPALSTERALEPLDAVLSAGLATCQIVDIDADAWCSAHPERASEPMFREIGRHVLHDGDGASDRVREIRSAPARRRVLLIEDYVVDMLARILRLDPERIDTNRPLPDFGVDSLTGLEIRNRIRRDLGVALRATMLWRFPTIDALVEHLAQAIVEGDHGADVAATGPTTERKPEQVAAAQRSNKETTTDLDALSEGDLANLLADELGQLTHK